MDTLRHVPRFVLACAAAVFTLHTARSAWATCSYSCSIALVDADCQPLDAAGPVAGDAVRARVNCDQTCCGGGANCTSGPVMVTAADVQLFGADNGLLPNTFSADPACGSVFVLDGCLSDGSYRVGFQGSYNGMSFLVSGDVCPPEDAGVGGSSGAGAGTGSAGPAGASSSDDGACSMGRSTERAAWGVVAFVAALGLAFRRRQWAPT